MKQFKDSILKKSIYSSLLGLKILTKTKVRLPNTEREYRIETKHDRIFVIHEFKFVPDFLFIWCNVKHHYRVYIATVDRSLNEKVRSKYAICTIKTKLDVMEFCGMYRFLHTNRANNRE